MKFECQAHAAIVAVTICRIAKIMAEAFMPLKRTRPFKDIRNN